MTPVLPGVRLLRSLLLLHAAAEQSARALRLEAPPEREGLDSSLLPIYWLHIPKTGSSFATTLAHATCGSSIREDVTVKDPEKFFLRWNSSCSQQRFMNFTRAHHPLQLPDPKLLQHVVVMQRRPAQRILSGYYSTPERLHDCKRLQEKYHCPGRWNRCDGDLDSNGHTITNPEVVPPLDYAACVENCSTNMLSGYPCGEGPANLTLALSNLARVGFVGLTEEWELSVCLWHARFGGQPLAAELFNTRPGAASNYSYNEADLLGNWRSSNDDKVFQAAKERFERELKEHGVTRQSCQEQLAQARRSSRKAAELSYEED